MFADFYGVNTPIMINFKLSTQHQLANKIPENLTICSGQLAYISCRAHGLTIPYHLMVWDLLLSPVLFPTHYPHSLAFFKLPKYTMFTLATGPLHVQRNTPIQGWQCTWILQAYTQILFLLHSWPLTIPVDPACPVLRLVANSCLQQNTAKGLGGLWR
jgi:hypothetical protein